MRKIVSVVLAGTLGIFLFGVSFSSARAAVTWDYNDSVPGKLAGASGVVVGSDIYDVTFVEGVCATIFDGCDESSDLDFASGEVALSAAQALLDQVFVDGPQANFDSVPSLTFGCDNVAVCQVYVPYAITPYLGGPGVNTKYAGNWSPAFNPDSTGNNVNDSDGPLYNTATNTNSVYARFTAVGVIPIPAALPLFLSALVVTGLLGCRRRQKAPTAA